MVKKQKKKEEAGDIRNIYISSRGVFVIEVMLLLKKRIEENHYQRNYYRRSLSWKQALLLKSSEY